MNDRNGMVGITTTIPIEVPFSAGKRICDLNNLFISSSNPSQFSDLAILEGYPQNICQWIKGLFGVAIKRDDIDPIIAVTQGDCSNTNALMETLEYHNKNIIPFAFPYDHSYHSLNFEISKLESIFNVNRKMVEQARLYLDDIRYLAHEIDKATYMDNTVTGKENHIYLVSTSDFKSDPEKYSADAKEFIKEIKQRKPINSKIRLAYLGVPPIFPDIYTYLESLGARVVYNQTQYDFSMPYKSEDIVYRYLEYTYPYSIFYRLKKVKEEINRRNIDGIIEYVQTFCFRQIEDIILRNELKGYPILTIEGGDSINLDERTKLRLQAFVEMLQSN